MPLYLKNKRLRIYHGDCRKVMRRLIDAGVQVDSIVTDPPYNLNFMNRKWDNTGVAFEKETWKLAYKMLKPGGHMLAFSATRTYHRMVTAIEDAGFEIRDQIGWISGQGMPKSLNISKAIDKELGKKPKVIGKAKYSQPAKSGHHAGMVGANTKRTEGRFTPDETAPNSKEAQKWEGWGTALKPSWEPIVLCRKPISEKTIAKNVLKYGTGGINIDECRISTDEVVTNHSRSLKSSKSKGKFGDSREQNTHQTKGQIKGRFPSNIIHDGSDEVEAHFSSFGHTKDGVAGKHGGKGKIGAVLGSYNHVWGGYGGQGSVSRFFYQAKANKHDRHFSKHPTVKPVALMDHLIKMVTPVGGTVLDPFCGSGSSVTAALNIPKCKIIAMELQKEYILDIERRIDHYYDTKKLIAEPAKPTRKKLVKHNRLHKLF